MEQSQTVLFRHLMKVPHGEYDELVPHFRQGLEDNPALAARFCVHLATGGTSIRDQADVSVIALLQASSEFPEYREAGRCLLLGSDVYDVVPDRVEGLPPFRIFKVSQYISQSDRRVGGLMRSTMADYFTMLESQPRRADGVVVGNRSAVKRAWHRCSFGGGPKKPVRFPYIHQLLGDDPPKESKVAILKMVAQETDPREQARLAMQSGLPARILASVLPKVTPAVAIVLVDAMSPDEARNSRAWVERSGILEIPEVKKVFLAKLRKAKSVATIDHRRSVKGADEDVDAALEEARETASSAGPKIEGWVDIVLDISGSMDEAIKVAPEFAKRLFPLCDRERVALIAHNSNAVEIKVPNTGKPLHDVETALRGVVSSGGTLHHRALELSLRMGRQPDKIALLTDGGENGPGNFVGVMTRYIQESGKIPTIVLILFEGHPNYLGQKLTRAEIPFEQVTWEGDYYAFDQAAHLLGGPPAKSKIDLINEIVLPHRAEWVLF